jgi:hypothetical protein
MYRQGFQFTFEFKHQTGNRCDRGANHVGTCPRQSSGNHGHIFFHTGGDYGEDQQLRSKVLMKCVPSPVPAPSSSSSIPSIMSLLTTPPLLIFCPKATITSNAADLVFSDGSLVPKTASGIRDGIICIALEGREGISRYNRLNRSW